MSTMGELLERVARQDALIAELTRAAVPATPEVHARMVSHQMRAEPIFQAFGDSNGAPFFLNGESETDYRIRLLDPFKQYSSRYRDSDLSKIADAAVFESVESSIYEAARASLADRGRRFKLGVLNPQHIRDAAGRVITKWNGDPMAAWNAFCPPPRYARLLTPTIHR
jgi:hypothetical protein